VVRDGSTRVAPWQRLELAELGLTAAVAATLRAGRPVWRPIGALLVAPGFSWVAARLYNWVATHRYALPGGTPACRVDGPNQPT